MRREIPLWNGSTSQSGIDTALCVFTKNTTTIEWHAAVSTARSSNFPRREISCSWSVLKWSDWLIQRHLRSGGLLICSNAICLLKVLVTEPQGRSQPGKPGYALGAMEKRAIIHPPPLYEPHSRLVVLGR